MTNRKEMPAHLHPKFAHMAFMSNDERLLFMAEPRWLTYPVAKQVMGMLDFLLKVPTQSRMPNMLLIGESNNGKTALLNKFVDAHEPYLSADDKPVLPVVFVQAPATIGTSGKEIYMSLLNAYSAPYTHKYTALQLQDQLLHFVRWCQTRLIIIDEIHSILTGTSRQQRLVMNSLKHLCNELKIPFVLSGTIDAVQVLHTDPQHASRFDVVELPLWKLDEEYATMVASFERILPLKEPSFLDAADKLPMIHSISRGCLGDTKRLLVAAATSAIKNGRESITSKDIEENKWVSINRGERRLIL
ncbi:TniB family NTP-binding protein [Moraxella pluranimalium]|uniref:Transposase n=1 Tax=Moraxella pluranimalium TaxID=470453 RepID=A0A1T0CTD2_9GAMM|nr:TniB family NTP-binding protein [Moraxella pluranimalium]OOS25592.1 hypothetical protein B0680_01830 [Moraxella pluranimalium]